MDRQPRLGLALVVLAGAGPAVLWLVGIVVGGLVLTEPGTDLFAGLGLAAAFVLGVGVAIGFRIARAGMWRRWFAAFEIALFCGVVLLAVGIGITVPGIVEDGDWFDLVFTVAPVAFGIHVIGLGGGWGIGRSL